MSETLHENPSAVDDYLDGKNSAVRFLVGQVMKKTKGKANPQVTSEMITAELDIKRES